MAKENDPLYGKSLIDYMDERGLNNDIDADVVRENLKTALKELKELGYKDCTTCLCIFPVTELDEDEDGNCRECR